MQIKLINIDKLVPYARNPRKNDETVAGLAGSIKEFGFRNPIIIDSENVIIAGHTRLKAAQKLNLKEVPCVIADDLTPAQIKAFRLLDNKIAEKSQWDSELLAAELSELQDFDFEPFEIDWGDLDAEENADTSDDEVPEPREEKFIKTGDIFSCGRHTVVCGDSADPKNYGSMASCLLTDPPYGVSYQGKTAEKLKVENDDLDEKSLESLIEKVFAACDQVLLDGATVFAAVPAGPLMSVFLNDFKQRGWLRQVLVWVKDSLVLGHGDYHYKHEPILYGWKPGKHYHTSDRTKTSVWEFDRPKRSTEHPTMKPIGLWMEALKNGQKSGVDEVALDPFLGSGTTLIAAERLGRTCYGIEISPVYVGVILQRFFNETGIVPVRTSDGAEYPVQYERPI